MRDHETWEASALEVEAFDMFCTICILSPNCDETRVRDCPRKQEREAWITAYMESHRGRS